WSGRGRDRRHRDVAEQRRRRHRVRVDVGDTAVVFPTCLVELVRPQIAAAVVALLRGAGTVPVVARRATCCGQPAWNSGFADDARRVARHTLKVLDGTGGSAPIVVPSGSCTAMIHEYWPVLFSGTADAAAASRVAGRVRELSS